MQIEVKQLGLAAFIKMHGSKLLDYKNNMFIFESVSTEKDWMLKYMQSECKEFDKSVMELRWFQNNNK